MTPQRVIEYPVWVKALWMEGMDLQEAHRTVAWEAGDRWVRQEGILITMVTPPIEHVTKTKFVVYANMQMTMKGHHKTCYSPIIVGQI